MRYSEAIRLGSMSREQAFSVLFDVNGRTCANGAALDAVGQLEDGLRNPAVLAKCFPIAAKSWVPCPACGCFQDNGFSLSLGGNVAHLNDRHRWARERIADWVEMIEKQHDRVSVPDVQDPVSIGLPPEAMPVVLAISAEGYSYYRPAKGAIAESVLPGAAK